MNNYKKKRWKRKREQILRRDKYLCQISIRYGKQVEADTVHHIFPIEFYPDLKYLNWNLISLSRAEHNKLHSRDSHNLTKAGLELQNRYKQKYLNWCKKNGVKPRFQEQSPRQTTEN